MKRVYFIVLVVFMSACAATYIEPDITNNDAYLHIKVDQPFKFNAPFGMILWVKIDGKAIDLSSFDEKFRVTPGKHTLKVGISAYYYNRAKYYVTHEYEINFKGNEMYTVSSEVEFTELKSLKDNVNATLYITGAGIGISDNVTLKDSALRSMVCQVPNCTPSIILIL